MHITPSKKCCKNVYYKNMYIFSLKSHFQLDQKISYFQARYTFKLDL